MNKKAKLIGMTMVAASLASSSWALVGGAQPGMPSAAMPSAAAPMAAAPMAAPTTSPVLPQAVTPLIDSAAQPGSVPAVGGQTGVNARQQNSLRQMSESKAELELLKIKAEIEKVKKPGEEAAKKDEAASLQQALEAAKRDHAASPAAEAGPPVTLLATFGSPDQPKSSYAELKVGDMLVHAKVGDRLPSGHYVKAINFDSVELSKSKTAKAGKVQYISATDTASVYSSRGRSGTSIESGSNAVGSSGAAPAGLPPMPSGR